MPKETVTPDVGPYQVQVGWAANQHLQVGVTLPEGEPILRALFDSEGVDRVGVAARDALGKHGVDMHRITVATIAESMFYALETASDTQYSGLWATLDRHDCNRLIRILRKGRDAAFGRDE